jgi:hypothetical protein
MLAFARLFLSTSGTALSAIFEVFNNRNSWSPTSMTTQAHIESKGVLTLTPTAYGFGASDAMNPDSTQAGRMEGSARCVF